MRRPAASLAFIALVGSAFGGGQARAEFRDAPSVPPSMSTNGTLQTEVPFPNYAGARKMNAFARLNAARQGAGAGLVAQSLPLDEAAADHAAYLSANGFGSATSPHNETAGLAGFTGTDPFVRMLGAGYKYSFATEVIGEIGSSSPATDCVGDLLDTIYHAALMLSRVTEVGIGFGSGDAAGMCSISLAAPLMRGAAQIPPSGAVVAYPYAGATVAHGTFLVGNENPRASLALLPAPVAGTPVLVSFRNEDYVGAGKMTPRVTIADFTLADEHGAPVPSVILADSTIVGEGVHLDIGLGSGFAVLVPVRPLPPGRYTVGLHAEIGGGQPLALSSWSFDVEAP